MKLRGSLATRYVPALLALLLPAILLYTSLRTLGEVEQMRSLFLRNRSAAIAGRLETLPGTSPQDLQAFIENEPGLLSLRVFSRPGDPALADLWNGRELFRTQSLEENSTRILRALVPFHSDGQLRMAQIDLDAGSADFLLQHARHNVAIATISGAVMVLLAIYALWSMRRAATGEKRRIELAHLAHLGKMSAVLAHEIRTPLGTIKGFTQLAMEQADVGGRAMLEPVLEETQRLERLVSDLLLYGRPPAPVLRECSWDEIGAPMRSLSPYVSVAEAPLRFRTDPDLLRHVVTNLVKNAADAVSGMPEPWVRVSASLEPDAVVISVDDNGPGIPDAHKNKVFESFYTTKSFGTGLGLPIARSLSLALGGKLSLSSREGGGTHVELRLPVAGARKIGTEVTA